MDNLKEHLKDISEIRTLMESQTKFLSLSGLSGISAGICALAGAFAAWFYFDGDIAIVLGNSRYLKLDAVLFTLLDAGLVLVFALSLALFFSYRMAKKRDLPFMNNTAFKVLVNLAIPLVAGGLFSIIEIYHGISWMVPATTLIFYGMALLNASKYTLNEIRYLGLTEIVLGIFCALFWEYSLLFWTLGFGVLHIVYGFVMYLKYER